MFLEEKVNPTPIKTLEPWRQLLLDAADYMEKVGHCKGVARSLRGQVCFIGTIYGIASPSWCSAFWAAANPNIRIASEAMIRYAKIVPLVFIEDPVQTVMEWNDAPERTGEEVIAAMRGAAQQAI